MPEIFDVSSSGPMNTVVVFYIILVLTHFGVQIVMAHLNYLGQRAVNKRESGEEALAIGYPPVSIIYPVYRESPLVLDKVLQKACECLEIPNFEIIVVDDGSPNLSELKPIYRKYSGEGLKVIYSKNYGKRRAQIRGLAKARGEYVIMVDSDTVVEKESIPKLLAPALRDARVGAVTGDVKVENNNANLLTRLIELRYWLAFNLERAAQTFSGTMLCCSGPFSIYRRDVLEKVKDAYINQTFLGRECTYGDDRHLTNLVITEGYRTSFQQDAPARTYVPTTMADYIVQQTRWNKSFFREIIWTFRGFRNFSLYSLWDILCQVALFFLFIFVMGHIMFKFLDTQDLKFPLYFLSLLVLMASVRAVYGLLRTENPRFLLFLTYGFLHVGVLMPLRLKALLTLKDNSWGSRNGLFAKKIYLNFTLWLAIFLACIAGVAALISAFIPNSILSNAVNPAITGQASLLDFASGLWRSLNYAALPFLLFTLLFVGLALYDRNRIDKGTSASREDEAEPAAEVSM